MRLADKRAAVLNRAFYPGEIHVHRRLAAILSADVQGYSRMMSANELATVQTLAASRRLITDVVESRRGRIVDMPGDNVLAEFGSAVEAVR